MAYPIDPSLIFRIQDASGFEAFSLDIFRYQAEHCPAYREYLSYLGTDPGTIDRVEKIPFLPIEVFKSHKIYTTAVEPELVFTSSATTGQIPSRHYVADPGLYEESFSRGFSRFYGDPAEYTILALLPSYLERSGSSLVYMADRLIRRGEGGGFFLHDYESLIRSLETAAGKGGKILLLGVSFALLELAKKYRFQFPNLTVMETGGMKGRGEEITREELHAILCASFGVTRIHSEYGMAELLSQGYSSGDGIFQGPPWMNVLVRDTYDPSEYVPDGRTGGVNIIDLANLYSCSFIETQDLGIRYTDGSFRIQGRIDKSEIRGCNLMA